MRDAVRSYWELANGLTEVTRQRAIAAARALVASGEATAEQVTGLADDLLSTSRTNRDAMLALVRYEVDRALGRMGLATVDDVAGLHHRLDALEGLLRQGRSGTSRAGSSPRKATAQKSTAQKATAQKSTAHKATAKRTTARKTTARKATTRRSTGTGDGGGSS